MKLSNELNNIAQGYSFNGKALREAYDSETITTTNDRQMLSRYMHGAELSSDRFRLQDLAMQFAMVGK